MKQVLIIEHQTSPLEKLNESNGASFGKKLLSGIFTEFDIMNRNERVYTPDKFIPALNEMNQRMLPKSQGGLGVVYGELDHPEDFNISIKTASHCIKKAEYIKEFNRVDGQIQLLSTDNGKKASAIIFEDGMPLFVSSRAAGVTTNNNRVEIKKLFTYDIVADPGFASAEVSPINESLGLASNKYVRIYEMKNETNINDLYMNNNQSNYVTTEMMTDYSNHINSEVQKMFSAIKEGKTTPDEILRMEENLESLLETQKKMTEYLDYFSSKTQTLVSMISDLEAKTDNIIQHNDYLAEHTNALANYSEKIGEQLNNTMNYTERIGEELNNVINYSDMIGEKLNSSINHNDLVTENVNKLIMHVDMIGENLDANIQFTELIGETFNKSLRFSEYLAECIFENKEYTQMIKEEVDNHTVNLTKSANHQNYLADNLNTLVNYTGSISEKLNGNFVNEASKISFPSIEEAGFKVNAQVEETPATDIEENTVESAAVNESAKLTTKVDTEDTEETKENTTEEKDKEVVLTEKIIYEDISESLDMLIESVREKQIAQNHQPHFLSFLDKNQVERYYEMTNEEQNKVKSYLDKKAYYSNQEVVMLINEALVKHESLEDRLINNIPSDVQEVWERMDESTKKSMLAQAVYYPSLDTKGKIEMFWKTRNFPTPINESSKVMLDHKPLISEDKLSDEQLNAILTRFNIVR